MKEKFQIKNILKVFIITFLPIFSFGIFGPTEIYFANITDLYVTFDEFGWKFLGIGILLALVLTLVLLLLPKLLQKILLAILWLVSVCGYFQILFFNSGVDAMGMTTDGYHPEMNVVIKDGIIWLVMIVVLLVLVIKTKEKALTGMAIISLILVASQGVAYGTLFINADERAFHYPVGQVTLDGSEQYQVSTEGNVIVIILDTVSNSFYEMAFEDYPEEMKKSVKDFTYYANTDCNYWGTYPSLQHIATGYALKPELPIVEWIAEGWSNDATTAFYAGLHQNDYKVHFYTSDDWLLSYGNGMEITEGKIDNLSNSGEDVTVDYPRLYKILLKSSAYRMMPNGLKPYFDVPNTAYVDLVTFDDNVIDYLNTDFYQSLCEKGLTTTNQNKLLIYQHLNGIHELVTDENCQPISEEDGTIDGVMLGMWTMLDEYFEQLKAVGAYDNSTIIVTADHGNQYDTQVIFFIKEPGESHDVMNVNRAPISLHELMPTIALKAGLDVTNLGQTIYDFSEGEERTRTCLQRAKDPDYPLVPVADGSGEMRDTNVWRAYTYTGDHYAYSHQYEYDLYETIPMKDYL